MFPSSYLGRGANSVNHDLRRQAPTNSTAGSNLGNENDVTPIHPTVHCRHGDYFRVDRSHKGRLAVGGYGFGTSDRRPTSREPSSLSGGIWQLSRLLDCRGHLKFSGGPRMRLLD